MTQHDGPPAPDDPQGPQVGSPDGARSPAPTGDVPAYETPGLVTPTSGGPTFSPPGPMFSPPGQPVPPAGASPYLGGEQPPGSYPPPPGGYQVPDYQAPGYRPPGRPGQSGTDGVAVAALVTGLLGLGLVPLVLGIVGLRRVARTGRAGRGMSITGIVLGAVAIVASVVVGILVVAGIVAYGNHIDDLRSDCRGGDMAACDTLYRDTRVGSDDERFGYTCGGRTDGGGHCTRLDDAPATGPADSADPDAYGDDPALDALWDQCAAGDGQACDDLYMDSPFGSGYEDFGDTCGARNAPSGYCANKDL